MDKKMYELKISETLSHLMPQLSAEEESLLTESLLDNGCREPLVGSSCITMGKHY
jgi:hypothetical protein